MSWLGNSEENKWSKWSIPFVFQVRHRTTTSLGWDQEWKWDQDTTENLQSRTSSSETLRQEIRADTNFVAVSARKTIGYDTWGVSEIWHWKRVHDSTGGEKNKKRRKSWRKRWGNKYTSQESERCKKREKRERKRITSSVHTTQVISHRLRCPGCSCLKSVKKRRMTCKGSRTECVRTIIISPPPTQMTNNIPNHHHHQTEKKKLTNNTWHYYTACMACMGLCIIRDKF